MGDIKDNLIREYAKKAADEITRKSIRAMQRITDTLSAADSGLAKYFINSKALSHAPAIKTANPAPLLSQWQYGRGQKRGRVLREVDFEGNGKEALFRDGRRNLRCQQGAKAGIVFAADTSKAVPIYRRYP